MAKKPIEIFKSYDEFITLAKDWQAKLFLDDWFITFKLTDSPIYMDENELWGVSAYSYDNSVADITVYNGKELQNSPSRNIAELTLVHELLHLKMEYFSDPDIVGEMPKIQESMGHRALEMMAKSLIMAKYNVPKEYFIGNVVLSEETLGIHTRGVR